MALILNIDTALDIASVCLAKDGIPLELIVNKNQKDNGAWPHKIIAEILERNNVSPGRLEAVAVSIGPGSYTGLRVGLAAAKGLCYVLKIPLLTINTLKLIAYAAKEEVTGLICPVIDARRMEVFTAVYDKDLQEKLSPQAMVIDATAFAGFLASSPILFCGNGSKKLQGLITHSNAFFSNTLSDASHLGELSAISFTEKELADLAYAEPLYIKEFYTAPRKIQ